MTSTKFLETGAIVALKQETKIDLTQAILPTCPSCRESLRHVNRYGRIVREALLVESTKKFINWSNSRHVPLAQRLQGLRE